MDDYDELACELDGSMWGTEIHMTQEEADRLAEHFKEILATGAEITTEDAINAAKLREWCYGRLIGKREIVRKGGGNGE